MEINQNINRINYNKNSQNLQNTSFGSIFRINLYNFEKADKKISREILKDELCPSGKIILNGKAYARKKILDLFTYFICEDKNDQYFINKLRTLGVKFDCCDIQECYESAIKAMTIMSEKMAGPIKSLRLRKLKPNC